jgi:SAM-dependent methyltransferase
VFVNLVETDMLWGHRNDPINFHRCLQDFDRRLPDLLDALRPGDLLIVTSDHGCDPTTPSTDHSREHALLLAYVAGKNANGRIHEGEFSDVGATVNACSAARPRASGCPARRSNFEHPERPRRRPPRVRGRGAPRRADRPRSSRRSQAPTHARSRSRRVAEAEPQLVLEVGPRAAASSPRWIKRELDARGRSAVDQSERMVELTEGARNRGDRRDVQDLPFRDGIFDVALAAWMLYHVPDVDLAIRELRRVLRPMAPCCRYEQRRQHARAVEPWSAIRASTRSARETARWSLLRHFTIVRRLTCAVPSPSPTARRPTATSPPRPTKARGADNLPIFDGPLVCTRHVVVFVAEP